MQGWRRHQAQGLLDEAVAAVDRADGAWRLADLDASRKPIADDHNPALVVIDVRSLLPESWEPGLPSPQPQHQLRPDQLEELQSQLQPLAQALARAGALANPADGRFPSPESKDPLAESKNCGDASIVAQLLRMQATALAQRGDADGAALATLGIAGTARAIGDERRLLAQLMRLRCRNELFFCVERLLGQGQPSEALLAKLQQALEEEAAVPASLFALEGERAGHHQLALAAEAGDIDMGKISLLATPPENHWKELLFGTLTTTLAREAHARMLSLMTDLVDVTRLPPEAQGDAEVKLVGSWVFVVGNYAFFPELRYRVRAVPVLFRVNLAWMRCATVAVAAERYRQTNNRWPDKVEDLTNGQLTAWATDPFSGDPIRLERRKDGLTVLSPGKVPDGGEGAERKRRGSYDSRRLIRLYDVNKRRQPAPPKPAEDREDFDEQPPASGNR
jgi:hypothetical protein